MAANRLIPSAWSNAFNNFFFDRQIPYGMALVRICLPLVLLVEMSMRWPWVVEFYSADGAPAPIAMAYGYWEFLPFLPGTWAVAAFTVMLLLMASLIVGWNSRLSAAGVFVLYTYFTMQDSLSSLTKYSVFSSHMFLLLSLSECGAVWSVDRLIELRRQGITRASSWLGEGRAVEVWPQRLLQLFIGIVYFGAAVTKMQTPTYFSGDQMRLWLLTNVNHWNPLGELLSLQPALLVPMCYIAIIWEITFVFMVWNKTLRVPFLAVGALFHFMTTLTLGLVVFPLVCFSLYMAFVTEEDVNWWRERIARRSGFLRSASQLLTTPYRLLLETIAPLARFGNVAYVGILLGVTALGLVGHRAMDLYAANTPTGRYELQPMDPQQARRMLRTDTVIREQDKLLSFDIGKIMVGGVVVETGKTFKTGDRIHAQANLIPPHEDLFVECQLVSDRGLVHDQSNGIAMRQDFRYTFNYLLPETLRAGDYQFILKLNNQEVARQTIKIAESEPETAQESVALAE